MGAIFEPLFTKLKCTTCQPVAQPKLRLRPFVKSLKSELIGSSKMLQEFETKISSLSLGSG